MLERLSDPSLSKRWETILQLLDGVEASEGALILQCSPSLGPWMGSIIDTRTLARYVAHVITILLTLLVALSAATSWQTARRDRAASFGGASYIESHISRLNESLIKPALPATIGSFFGIRTTEVDRADAGQNDGTAETFASTLSTVSSASESKTPLKPIQYKVAAGDTVTSIAARFAVTAESIIWANDLEDDPDHLAIGRELVIPPVAGMLHRVREGNTVVEIAQKYQVEPKVIIEANSLESPYILRLGQLLVIPGGKLPARPIPVARNKGELSSAAKPQRALGRFIWPTHGSITTYFGERGHHGLDIANRSGTPIYAADNGRVIAVRKQSYDYGWHIVIDHGNGFTTLYAHLSGFNVDYGQWVERGAVIGWMGSTGRSTGPHLHFEITLGGTLRNPLTFLP
ncbi:MAG: M23 family metallopeptidase [Chloroflexi bacterium]|nr:M23 family metallopeptidase [Chloroflexota bacterium]MCL5076255.1 M23 family metallopeptidase [Chloroflexota bacterium]